MLLVLSIEYSNQLGRFSFLITIVNFEDILAQNLCKFAFIKLSLFPIVDNQGGQVGLAYLIEVGPSLKNWYCAF